VKDLPHRPSVRADIGEVMSEAVLIIKEEVGTDKAELVKRIEKLEGYLRKVDQRVSEHVKKIDHLKQSVTGNKTQIDSSLSLHQLKSDYETNA